MFRNFSLNRLLVLTASAGFTFLLADTIIEHIDIFNSEILSFIPPLFSLLGMIIGFITVYKWQPKFIHFMHYFLFLSFIVGAAGVYLHAEEEKNDVNLTLEERIHEEKEKPTPLLAPLAFGGIAVIGLLGTYRKWAGEVVDKL